MGRGRFRLRAGLSVQAHQMTVFFGLVYDDLSALEEGEGEGEG